MNNFVQTIFYIICFVSFILAIGGIKAWKDSRYFPLLISSLITIIFVIIAVNINKWWPLFVSYGLNVIGQIIHRKF